MPASLDFETYEEKKPLPLIWKSLSFGFLIQTIYLIRIYFQTLPQRGFCLPFNGVCKRRNKKSGIYFHLLSRIQYKITIKSYWR